MNIMNIRQIKTQNDIAKAFDVLTELRPHLKKEIFVDQIIEQQSQGYKMIIVEENSDIVSYIGFRFFTTLAWGKIIYIDDLITKESSRGKGYAKALLEHVKNVAIEANCNQIHLDSGYTRYLAHKFYLKENFELNAHHLMLKLK